MTINSNPQLNDTDLELLSAYIDSQLADSERAALERRLSQEPELRGVLDELRATVGLLHELEPLKPPRSFAIAAPATAPRRRWSFQWPAIASALVALVCVLTFSYALIRSNSGGLASAPAPAAMQEAAAPTAAAAGGVAPDAAMRQATTDAPAAAAPTAAAAAAAPAAPMAAAEAPAATPAPTIMASSGAGAIATAQPASAAQSAADSAAPTAAAAAEAPASSALLQATPAQPYSALVATSEISSPGTVTLDQPPIVPTANSAPSGGSRSQWLLAGIVALLIAIGIGLALRRKART